MTTKDLVIESVKNMPDDAVIEDAMERLLVIAKIERGIEQADSGQTIPHDEVKKRLSKWLN
jgi:predicted transcriptional regulator